MNVDLFGAAVPDAPAQREPKKGYAARPGSGPKGMTCRTCLHAQQQDGGTRNYWKCAIIRHRWTHGPGTDIRLKSPACFYYQPITKKI
jgi:hypothetical protein